MDKTDWRILQEIYNERSMTKVSEKLFISQPAISYRLKKIEEEYQKSLFIRSPKGVQLTDAGLRLHKYASTMLHYAEEISASVHRDPADYSGLIKIGATVSFTNYFLVKQLEDFCSIYKKIGVQLELHPAGTLFKMFEKGELMAVVLRGNRFSTTDQNSYVLFEEPLLIIANEPITEEYLRTHPFIYNSPGVRLPIDDLINEWLNNNFEKLPSPSPIQISGDSRTMVHLVKAGFGWTIISKTRLIEGDALYHQPIYQKDGTPYHFLTQLFYSHEAAHFEAYQIYLQHFKQFFENTYGHILK